MQQAFFCPRCGTSCAGAAFCPRCGLQLAGPPRPKPSQFLDLGANARSCLGCIGLVFVLCVGAVLFMIVASR